VLRGRAQFPGQRHDQFHRLADRLRKIAEKSIVRKLGNLRLAAHAGSARTVVTNLGWEF
jgi:hypothetical protein